jgi:hypothetical protein
MGECVGLQSGPKWRMMRKYLDPEYSHQASIQMIPDMSKYIDAWVNELSKNPIRPAGPNGAFVQNIMRACKNLAFRLLSLSLYGEAFDETVGLIVLHRLVTSLLISVADLFSAGGVESFARKAHLYRNSRKAEPVEVVQYASDCR